MRKRVYRNTQGLLLLLSLLVLAGSFYFQYFKGLQPCPLCLMQRACTFLLTFLCIIGVCLSLKRARAVAVFQILMATLGSFFALRQLWLQSLSAGQNTTCMPSLDVLMRYFPWQDVVRVLFWGTGNCSEVGGAWLGLSMPIWSFLYFLSMIVVSSVVYWRLGRPLEPLA